MLSVIYYCLSDSGGTVVKNLPANARDTRDMGLIPGSGKSPGEENPLDRNTSGATVHGVAKS